MATRSGVLDNLILYCYVTLNIHLLVTFILGLCPFLHSLSQPSFCLDIVLDDPITTSFYVNHRIELFLYQHKNITTFINRNYYGGHLWQSVQIQEGFKSLTIQHKNKHTQKYFFVWEEPSFHFMCVAKCIKNPEWPPFPQWPSTILPADQMWCLGGATNRGIGYGLQPWGDIPSHWQRCLCQSFSCSITCWGIHTLTAVAKISRRIIPSTSALIPFNCLVMRVLFETIVEGSFPFVVRPCGTPGGRLWISLVLGTIVGSIETVAFLPLKALKTGIITLSNSTFFT